MADYLRLFLDQRLTAKEPHMLEYIKARLAFMKIEDPAAYEKYSKFYGVEVDASVTKVPKTTEELVKRKPRGPNKKLPPTV